MLEIYNESVRDLLSTNRTISIEPVVRADGTSGRQYAITHDVNGNTHVSDLTIVDVCSIGQISSLLQQAGQSRFVSTFWIPCFVFPSYVLHHSTVALVDTVYILVFFGLCDC